MISTLKKSIREYKKASILTPLFVGLEVVLECLLPRIMALLIDAMQEGSLKVLILYGTLLTVMALLSLLCGVLSGYFAATASCGFAKNLRSDLFSKIQRFAFADIDSFSSASLVTRMTGDVTNVQNAYQMIIRIAVRTPLMFVFSVVMSFSISVKMSFIFLCVIPFLALTLILIIKKATLIFKKIFKRYDAMNNIVQENLAGIRVVKAFVREDFEVRKFENSSSEVCSDFIKAEKLLALTNPVMMFCIYAVMLLICALGSKLIISSGAVSLTTGGLSSLMNYGVQILMSMMMLSRIFVMVGMAGESAKRIAEVLESSPAVTSPKDGITTVADGAVEFKNVSFRYSSGGKKNVLENINLKVEKGSTLGIIGGTGSSKSTLVLLLPRLYDALQGEVLVGGVNVKDYNLGALRDAVSVVLQKNVLFRGTIKENLLWGNPDAADKEIQWACKAACADEFIQSFEKKYDTYIEQGGTNVSGGQKQRLCIARALLKKPKVLILDDSTSAVDTRTDSLIRKALKEELAGTTKIIIAQRISSVQDADLIIVMEDGIIKEKGTHEQLLKLGGIYKEIYETQNKKADE